MWGLLHRDGLTRDLSTRDGIELAIVFMQEFIDSVPCGGCRRDAKLYLKSNPADFSSPEAWFAWGVDFHDYVMRRNFSVPAVGHSLARKIWEAKLDADSTGRRAGN